MNFKISSKIILFLICLSISPTIQSEKLRIHVIPHSHDDVGWLKTMDEYYYTQPECVECILNNVVTSLENNKERTFVYSEISFFEKWYRTQSQETITKVKEFIKEGRFEFVNGGWVMNDEACAVTQDVIDQMRYGLNFLKKEFNYTPKVAWQLDPFGHSRTNAYVLSQLGFENLVLVRIDYKEKEIRKSKKEMEFIWKPYHSVDQGKANIFTHITHGHYDPDLPFYYEKRPIENWELPAIANKAYFSLENISSAYKTKNVMVLYGDDFKFTNDMDFKNMEIFMDFIKNDHEFSQSLEIFYSTPSKYFNDIKKENSSWPELRDNDFFPYSDRRNCYWTGYFSSRPYLKGYIRDIRKYLSYYTNLYVDLFILQKDKLKIENSKSETLRKKYYDQLNSMRNALAIAQHHDAVSGTAREFVSEDYINILESSNNEISKTVKEIMLASDKEKNSLNICIPGAAEFNCNDRVYTLSDSEKERHFIFINNQKNQKNDSNFRSTFPITLQFKTTDFEIFTQNGEKINNYDVFCKLDQKQNTLCSVTFLLEFASDLSYIHYVVKHSQEITKLGRENIVKNKYKSYLKLILSKMHSRVPKYFENNSDVINIKDNKNVQISFSLKNGFKYLVKNEKTEYNFEIKYATYDTNRSSDVRSYDSCNSGAYMFAPTSLLPINEEVNVKESYYFEGSTSFQLFLKFEWCTLKLIIYKNDQFDYLIESKTIMYPIKDQNKEYLFVLQSIDIDNTNNELGNLEFFTDTSDALLIQRIKDYRFGWTLVKDEPVADNFYPINSVISIRDVGNKNPTKKISVWNDRSQAGTSIQKGTVYLMMNRISDQDDSRGLCDGVYEKRNLLQDYQFTHLVTIGDQFDKKFVHDYIKTNTMVVETNNRNVLHNIPKEVEELIFIEEENKDCLLIDLYVLEEFKFMLQIMNKFSDPYFNNGELINCSFRLNTNILGADFNVTESNLKGDQSTEILKGLQINEVHSLAPYQIITFLVEKIQSKF